MCRNLFVLSLILGITSAVYAWDGPPVMGDWENSLDGWESCNTNNSLSYSTYGVTLNNYSLRLQVAHYQGWPTGGNAWYSVEMRYQLIGDARQVFLSSTGIAGDVTTLAADWQWDSGAGWHSGAQFCAVINCGNTTGQSIWSVKESPWIYPENGDTSRYLIFDFSAERQTVAGWDAMGRMGEGSWIEICILDKFPTYVQPPGAVWYMDNFTFVPPEPATLLLLGLGATIAIRRR